MKSRTIGDFIGKTAGIDYLQGQSVELDVLHQSKAVLCLFRNLHK